MPMSFEIHGTGEVVSSDAGVILTPRLPENLRSGKCPTVFPKSFIDNG